MKIIFCYTFFFLETTLAQPEIKGKNATGKTELYQVELY